MTDTPLVSVCIANFNGEPFIMDCINSIQSQKSKVDYEIIIHDDASSDNSVTLIRQKFPDIYIIESEQNVGYCVANNRMVDHAKGDFILLLNNDARIFDGALDTLYNASHSMKHQAILGLPQYDYNTRQLIDIGSRLDPFLNPVPNLDSTLQQVGMIMGACMWIPIHIWKNLQGFPEWFESIGEDLYFCCRARVQGYHVVALPYSGYLHHIGMSFGGGKVTENLLSTTMTRRALSERNKTYCMIITYPLSLLLLLLPLHIVLLYVEGLMLSLIKLDYRLWRGIYTPIVPSVFRNLAKLVQYRNITRSRSTLSLPEFLRPFIWVPYKAKMLVKYGIPNIRTGV